MSADGLTHITSFGDIGVGEIKGSIESNVAAEIDLALNDTYTVFGTASGPFDITVTLNILGSANSIPFSTTGNFILESALARLKIGVFDIDPGSATHIPGVLAFPDPGALAQQAVPFELETSPFSVPIDVTASYTKTVSVGDMFDLAYEASLSVLMAELDASHTALISFVTPNGVYLTSALGGEFGDVPTGPPPSGVPEPATLALFGFGLAGLVGRHRRAKKV